MTIVQIRCFLNEFFSSWFTILEQVLENMVRPVQLALKMNIISVIKQFTDFWRVLLAITIFVRRVAEKTVSGSVFHI